MLKSAHLNNCTWDVIDLRKDSWDRRGGGVLVCSTQKILGGVLSDSKTYVPAVRLQTSEAVKPWQKE